MTLIKPSDGPSRYSTTLFTMLRIGVATCLNASHRFNNTSLPSIRTLPNLGRWQTKSLSWSRCGQSTGTLCLPAPQHNRGQLRLQPLLERLNSFPHLRVSLSDLHTFIRTSLSGAISFLSFRDTGPFRLCVTRHHLCPTHSRSRYSPTCPCATKVWTRAHRTDTKRSTQGAWIIVAMEVSLCHAPFDQTWYITPPAWP